MDSCMRVVFPARTERTDSSDSSAFVSLHFSGLKARHGHTFYFSSYPREGRVDHWEWKAITDWEFWFQFIKKKKIVSESTRLTQLSNTSRLFRLPNDSLALLVSEVDTLDDIWAEIILRRPHILSKKQNIFTLYTLHFTSNHFHPFQIDFISIYPDNKKKIYSNYLILFQDCQDSVDLDVHSSSY